MPDPFGPEFDVDPPRQAIAIALPRLPPLDDGIASLLSARRAAGDVPGLFGGSRDEAVCDVGGLVEFLTDPANREEADAWAEVIGIDVADIGSYVDGLTAVRLRSDSRVTNHGFADGRPRPIQSVLQAGTAVLVDAAGVPRVKCSCGNPLLEPAPVDGGGEAALDLGSVATNPGDAWPGFDPALVVTIDGGAAQDDLVLLDLGSGALFSREVGSNGDSDSDVRDLDDKCEGIEESPSCGDRGAADADDPLDGGSFCAEPVRRAFGRFHPPFSISEDVGELDRTDRIEVEGLGVRFVEELARAGAPPPSIVDDLEVVTTWIEAVVAGSETSYTAEVDAALERLDDFGDANC